MIKFSDFSIRLTGLLLAGMLLGLCGSADAQSQRYKTGAGQARQASEPVTGGGALTTNSVLLTGAAAAIIAGIIAVAVDEEDDSNPTVGVGITATSTN